LVRLAEAPETELGLETRGEPSPQDRATILSYAPEYVEIEVALASPGWLVLTDAHYPGWQALVDGQPVDILRANILFRAVPLPAGQHIVTFVYQPASLRQGAVVSSLALLLVSLGLVVTRRKQT
jgi:uncharacterized membrane protein YfhO